MIDRRECEHLIGAIAIDLADADPDPTLPTEWCDGWGAAVREHGEPLAEQLRLALAEIDRLDHIVTRLREQDERRAASEARLDSELSALIVARNADRTEWMTTYETMRALIDEHRHEDVGPFADGELSPERAAGFRLHLATCEACEAALLGILQQSAILSMGEPKGKTMTDSTPCPHAGLYWYGHPHDEAGWKCVDCDLQPGEPPGFSPAHDRSHLRIKVWCIVHDLADAKIISVSNSGHGEGLASAAAAQCEERKLYDSVSIARVILEIEGDERHAKFWRDISDGILAGNDPRHRCHCGKLATIWRGGEGDGTRACSFDHLPGEMPDGSPF